MTTKSKNARMADAIAKAREARDALENALGEVDAIREEYREWYDAMNENWQQGETGQRVEAMADVDVDAGSLLSEVGTALDELEGNL